MLGNVRKKNRYIIKGCQCNTYQLVYLGSTPSEITPKKRKEGYNE